MTATTDQIQLLYELAMSIGASLDLRQMLRASLSTILRRLNCPAGGVHFLAEGPDGEHRFDEVFSFPRETNGLAEYDAARAQLPMAADRAAVDDFRAQLPLSGQSAPDRFFHILALRDLGVLILIKHGQDLQPVLINHLNPICDKLAGACHACLQNEELMQHRSQLQERVDNKVAQLQQTTSELVASNDHLRREIVERGQVEQELQVSIQLAKAADRAKTAFLANVSHEVRTPLNAIIGLTNLALNEELSGKVRGQLEKSRTSSDTLLALINDFLDLSRIEAGKMELEATEFDLRELLSEIADLVGENVGRKQLELLISIGADVPCALVGDPLRLGQVLSNLASNAVKFTEAGEVLIQVEFVQGDPERVTLELGVKDSGIGIDPEHQQRLFEAFTQVDISTTRKYGGSGLGLAICRHLVELMGGELRVESQQGVGSRFFFVVELQRQRADRELRHTPPEGLLGLDVLVVDDNPISCDILAAMLAAFGFSSRVVHSGEAALEALLELRDAKQFDLILMDWKMPGMDGIEASKHIMAHPKLAGRVPKLLMVTAFGSDEVVKEANRAGLEGVVLKPVDQSVLFNSILDVFGREPIAVMATTSQKKLSPPPQLRGVRALVVDDIEINQEIACAILQDAGITTDVVKNGLEAVEAVHREPYDVVLMDLQMPEMDGLEATRAIRSHDRFSALPIVAMTAHALRGDRERCLEAGMDDYVAKPIEPSELLERIASVLEQRGSKLPRATASTSKSEPDASDTPPTELPGVSLRVALQRLNGRWPIYRRLLIGFAQRFGGANVAIEDALRDRDLETALRMAHTLKGVAANLAADTVCEQATALEKTIRAEDADAYAERLEALRLALETVNSSAAGLEAPSDASAAVEPHAHSSAELAPAAPLLAELSDLLKRRSFKAKRCFEALNQVFDGAELPELLARIGESIEGLEFEQAGLDLQTFIREHSLEL